MKLLGATCIFGLLLAACSYQHGYIKERDARNAFVEKALVIPPNMQIGTNNNPLPLSDKDYVDQVVFALIFNESLNDYRLQQQNLSMDKNDLIFLGNLHIERNWGNIREELNSEYLRLSHKDRNFINKILHRRVNETVSPVNKEYLDLNNLN